MQKVLITQIFCEVLRNCIYSGCHIHFWIAICCISFILHTVSNELHWYFVLEFGNSYNSYPKEWLMFYISVCFICFSDYLFVASVGQFRLNENLVWYKSRKINVKGYFPDSAPLHILLSVFRTQYSLLITQYSVLSTQYSLFSTEYSVLSTQCFRMEEKQKTDLQRRKKYENFRMIREEKMSKIREK